MKKMLSCAVKTDNKKGSIKIVRNSSETNHCDSKWFFGSLYPFEINVLPHV